MSKSKYGQSLFMRLILTFLLIMIPIYAMGIYIYNWGLVKVQNEIHKSTLAQSHYYLDELEKEVERMKLLQFDCLNDDALNKLAFRSEVMNIYDIVQNINLLRQRLITIQNSSSYIKNVSAHIATIGRTISSQHGLDELLVENYENIRAPAGQKGARIVIYKEQFYLSTIQYNNFSSISPPFIIEIELNKDAFLQALRQFETYEGSISSLFSLTSESIVIAQTGMDLPISTVEDMKPVRYNQREYYTVYARSSVLHMGLVRYLPSEVLQSPLRNFYLWLWAFTLTAFFLIVVYSYSTYRMIHKPLLSLVHSFRKVEQGDLKISIQSKSKDEFGYLYEQFNAMVRNLDHLIDQVYNQKLLMQRAELKQLQSQINPHFLYNSFFTINTMARLGDENIVAFSKLLGEYYQFITRNTSDYIALSQEVRHAFIYTEIQKIRFSRRLEIIFGSCPEELAQLKVPRLILQPIMENAFNHGVEQLPTGGKIIVSFYFEQNILKIVIEDNGSNIADYKIEELEKIIHSELDEKEVTGLINIHRRIGLVFGNDSGLAFSRSSLGGLRACLTIVIKEGVKNV